MTSPRDSIICLPNDHLRTRSQKVGIITDEIRAIVEQMQEATLDWEDNREHEIGVALAAVQIDSLYRIVVIRNNFDNKQDRTFQTYINPEITKFEGDIIEDYEGCLSVKDIYGRVPRYNKVKVKANSLDGREFRVTAEGFLARIFQHEIDHTNGILFIDHIKEDEKAFYELNSEGQLEALDYEKDVRDNNTLWK